MARVPRTIDTQALNKANLKAWLNELGFDVDEIEDDDLRFDITPYFNAHVLIGEAMVELLIVERFEHLDEAVALKIVNQLNGRRFTPKWLVRDEGSVICAYRYDWQGNVRFSDFARVVRIVGAMATRGYQWLEQADDAARRYKEEQVQEQGEASEDDRAATKPDATESGTATNRSNKILH